MPAAGGERSFTNERLRIGSRDTEFPQESAFAILFQNCPERQSLYERPSAVTPEAANAAPNPPFARTAYARARHPDRSRRDGQALRAERRGSGARADQAPSEQSSGLRGAAVRPSAPRPPARAVGSYRRQPCWLLLPTRWAPIRNCLGITRVGPRPAASICSNCSSTCACAASAWRIGALA